MVKPTPTQPSCSASFTEAVTAWSGATAASELALFIFRMVGSWPA